MKNQFNYIRNNSIMFLLNLEMRGVKRTGKSPNEMIKRLKKDYNFQKSWESEFFVIEQGHKAICLVENCGKRLGLRKSTIESHFKSQRSDFIDKLKCFSDNELAQFKIEKFNEFKVLFEKNDNSDIESIDNKQMLASYKIAYLIAKNLKYFSDAEFVKTSMVIVAKTLFPNNFEIIEQFEKVNLERHSISEKIVNISRLFESELKVSCSNVKYFSICLDESKDKTDVKHLVFFIRGVFNN